MLLCISLCSTKALFAQVNLPTGSAQVNFPLFSYSTAGKLGISINLNYEDGNGVRITEIASHVGLGWSLQAGGYITRSTRGEPDDQVGGTLEGDNLATGRLFSNYANAAMPQTAGWIPLRDYTTPYYRGDASTIDDREADVLTYNINGRQGSFIVGLDGSIKQLDNGTLKIEIVKEDLSSNKVLTRWSKFIVTDESGIRYTFSDKELDRIILYQMSNEKQFFLNPPPANLQTYVCKQAYKVTNYSAVNNWYLSEILDPLTNKKITFTYEDYNLDYIAGIQGNYSLNPSNDGLTTIVAQRIEPHFTGVPKRLTTINLPDNNQVVFSYFSMDRADLAGDKALQQITIKKDANVLYGYSFDYQYFCLTNVREFTYGFTADEKATARLCLKAFRRFGTNSVMDNPYQFTYNTGSTTRGVPARLTPAFDNYGFYNGNTTYDWNTDIGTYNNVQQLCIPNRRVVTNIMNVIGAGVLIGVKYPTGGTLNYEYENNDAINGTNKVLTAGVRVKKITLSDGIGASRDIVKEYKYVLEDGTTSSGWGYEAPRYLDTTYSTLVIPTKGTYTAANFATTSALKDLKAITNIRNAADAGNYAGKTDALNDAYGSLGRDVINQLLTLAINYLVKEFSSYNEQVSTLSNQVYFSTHAANTNPLPLLYSRVEQYEGSADDNLGKTVSEFTSDKDFAINFPYQNYLYAPKQRCVPWLYGLLKHQTTFSKSGDPIEEVYNKYNATVKIEPNGLFTSTTYSCNNYLITTDAGYVNNYTRISFSSEKYNPISGNALLAYTINKNYNGNNMQQFRTDYEYDPTYNDLKKITHLNSINEKIEKRIYYPYDYSATGIFKTMMDNHIYNLPISSETWLYKTETNEQMIGADIREFQQLSTGDIKPVKLYLLTSNAPVTKSTMGAFSPTTLIRNTTYLKEAINYTYNSAGFLATTTANNQLSSYVYNDNNELVIAQVSNAGLSDIGYSSFEPGAQGTWTLTPTGTVSPAVVDATAPTGAYVLNMANVKTITKTGLDPTKKYLLTYWKKNSTINVSGGTLSEQLDVMSKGSWNLVSMYVTGTSTLTITGTGLLDELRLCPAQCQLTSTSYNTQLHPISTMGPNNVAVYYDYDELDRMKNTYDSEHNLVKSTNYNYVKP